MRSIRRCCKRSRDMANTYMDVVGRSRAELERGEGCSILPGDGEHGLPAQHVGSSAYGHLEEAFSRCLAASCHAAAAGPSEHTYPSFSNLLASSSIMEGKQKPADTGRATSSKHAKQASMPNFIIVQAVVQEWSAQVWGCWRCPRQTGLQVSVASTGTCCTAHAKSVSSPLPVGADQVHGHPLSH